MLDRKPPQQVRPPPPLKILCSFAVEDLVCSSTVIQNKFIRHCCRRCFVHLPPLLKTLCSSAAKGSSVVVFVRC
uniref:Uncharacterized protein n=1 Tax=Cucumis melo TaxID=3656 RepID=A0A9I9DJ83_CUCME